MVEIGFQQNEENFCKISHASFRTWNYALRNCGQCTLCPSLKLVWPVPLAQVWTHYQIGKLQHVNIALQCYVLNFWTAKYESKSCLNWIVSLRVLPCAQLIFSSKTWFFGTYLNFSVAEITSKIKYLPHSESKSYQINSIKSYSSRSFQEHQRHIPIPPKFSANVLI
jgi:hypothetical protein